jgi:hypothetical protein
MEEPTVRTALTVATIARPVGNVSLDKPREIGYNETGKWAVREEAGVVRRAGQEIAGHNFVNDIMSVASENSQTWEVTENKEQRTPFLPA